MRTIKVELYKAKELNQKALDKAVMDTISFEIDIMDKESPYHEAVKEMERLRTPWFLASYMFENYYDGIVETLTANEYEYYKDGTFYVGGKI